MRWSVVTTPEHVDEDGDQVVGLLGYPHSYQRSPLDTTCEAMPPALVDLIPWLHSIALPVSFHRSLAQVTTQRMRAEHIYYTAFESVIGRHRDNFRRARLNSKRAAEQYKATENKENLYTIARTHGLITKQKRNAHEKHITLRATCFVVN